MRRLRKTGARAGLAAVMLRDPARLRDEIATLERRLEQIGPDGDCGYESALIRFLEQQLGMRREWLRAAR